MFNLVYRPGTFNTLMIVVSLCGLSACGSFNQLSARQTIKVKSVQNLVSLANLSEAEAEALRLKFKPCLSSEDALIAGLNSPQVTGCDFLVQQNSNLSAEQTPWTEDHLRHDRSFLTERSIQLRYQGANGAEMKLQTYTQLKAQFGPVDSPAKALSFVLLKTAFSQILSQKSLDSYVLLSKEAGGHVDEILRRDIDSTQVETLPDGGFRIKNLLLNADCPSSRALAVNYLISRSGDIQRESETPIYSLTRCPVE